MFVESVVCEASASERWMMLNFSLGLYLYPPQTPVRPRAHTLSAVPVLSGNDRFSVPGEESDTFLWIPGIRDRPAVHIFCPPQCRGQRDSRAERQNRGCKRDSRDFREHDNHMIRLGKNKTWLGKATIETSIYGDSGNSDADLMRRITISIIYNE